VILSLRQLSGRMPPPQVRAIGPPLPYFPARCPPHGARLIAAAESRCAVIGEQLLTLIAEQSINRNGQQWPTRVGEQLPASLASGRAAYSSVSSRSAAVSYRRASTRVREPFPIKLLPCVAISRSRSLLLASNYLLVRGVPIALSKSRLRPSTIAGAVSEQSPRINTSTLASSLIANSYRRAVAVLHQRAVEPSEQSVTRIKSFACAGEPSK
jgi:hypothetical protein